MNKKTILVTGGAGYIGSFTVKELLNNGFKVLVIDNLENGHIESIDKRAFFEKADLANKKDLNEIFSKYKINAVIDFAAYTPAGESMTEPEKFLVNNLYNFVNLLDVMAGHNCKIIVKSSTAAVYGNPLKESDFPLKEEYTENFQPSRSYLLEGIWRGKKISGNDFFEEIINNYNSNYKNQRELLFDEKELSKLKIPTSVYGLTKLADEILLKKYEKSSNIKSVALRYFNVCGADPSGEMGEDKPEATTLMTMAIYTILGKNKELKVFGNDYPTKDGTCIRDYIHPIDLAHGHVAALKYLFKNNNSDIFNLGFGKGFSVLEVIKAVENTSNKKVNYSIVERRSGDPSISISDPSKAEKVLSWKAKYNLGNMAETAWRWHSKYPDGYSS